MSDLRVFDTTVPGVLDSLRKGEWLVPEFQRDFVWSTDQVSALVQSVLDARPIGMVTLWEQGDHSALPIEPVSILDQDPNTRRPSRIFFSGTVRAAKRFALLDGRQRCTAIAMAFGGFRAINGLYRYSGRYFLDVTQRDPRKRVRFIRERDVRRQNLDADATCLGKGLFPLASNDANESILAQWMRYLQTLQKPDIYPNGVLPPPDELNSRNRILQEAFEGIVRTKLAVYVVPERYSLADICDIFETLNTTGTKVSTVDLIHAWLYSDTHANEGGPFLLREWIDDLGQRDGTIGWSSLDDRPELIAQFVTACHVALVDKPAPRALATGRPEPITSIKSSDLLATPAAHWINVKGHSATFSGFVGDAQKTVAGGYFPWNRCPYPASMAVYVALRWHLHFDAPELHPWSTAELNALFRAFFWRNALSRRYDQGFLSQVGTDITQLKAALSLRPECGSGADWAVRAGRQLDVLFEYPAPTREELVDLLLQGGLGGAIWKALTLPMFAAATKDPIDPQIDISFPATSGTELHHIYPREWCRNNRAGDLAEVLNPGDLGPDPCDSVANQMPLSRTSNNLWRQRVPAQFIAERGLSFAPNRTIFEPLFIDAAAFASLAEGPNRLRDFWHRRADLIADRLTQFMTVHFGY